VREVGEGVREVDTLSGDLGDNFTMGGHPNIYSIMVSTYTV
jgi:hypothetical protein